MDGHEHLGHPFWENVQRNDEINFEGKSAAADTTIDKLTVSSELDGCMVRIPHADEGFES